MQPNQISFINGECRWNSLNLTSCLAMLCQLCLLRSNASSVAHVSFDGHKAGGKVILLNGVCCGGSEWLPL